MSDLTRASELLRGGEALTVQSQRRVVAAAVDLETIVRGVAARDPVVSIGGQEYGDYICTLCPDDWDDDEWREHAGDVVHAEGCWWRQAREWVEAHPETDR